MTTKILDITENRQSLADFIHELGPVVQPIDLIQGGQFVARLVPPGELSEAEKEAIVRKGWTFVIQARAKGQGIPEREIAKAVDTTVKRVRKHQ
jgi:hypothetical protein